MFSTIKTKVMLFLSGLLAMAGLVIKFLLMRNKVKDEKIDTLEQNIEVTEQMHEMDIQRVKFEAKQAEKAKAVNSEDSLDKLDDERRINGKQNESDNWVTVKR